MASAKAILQPSLIPFIYRASEWFAITKIDIFHYIVKFGKKKLIYIITALHGSFI